MEGSGLGFGILGPLEVTRDGLPVAVGGPKLRVVLAALLLRANATVSLDELAEDLWGEHQPPTARKAAQLHALRLRRVLGDNAMIETRPDGYLMRLEPARLDLLRFRQLVGRAKTAEPERERELLAEALACWRGDALSDVPAESFQREAAVQLGQERLRARERYLEVSLELGKHVEIIADLGALTRENPWREPMWALLILALHRSGRRADALETYRTVHRMLTDELGVEPGMQLRAAHQEVLTQPDDLPATPPAGCQLPADLPTFSGRTSDLETLDGFLASAHRTMAIVGPGGIGKTALAVQWAHRVRDRFPDGQLFVDLRGYASTSPVSKTQALTLCLRGLGVSGGQVPVTLDEQVVLYRSLLAGRRVLVVLDNAADADHVRPLLPPNSGCVALVTSRGDLRGLTVLNDARVLSLDVLTPPDTRALLTQLLGEDVVGAEPGAVGQFADLCGHLPLALRIAAANLVGGKHASVGSYVATLRADRLAELAIEGDPDIAVQATFQLSYQALDEPARRAFRLLGRIPGPSFTFAAAVALVGPAERTRRWLDRLVSANLLSRRSADRYQFHDLLREFAAACARDDEPSGELAAADIRLYDHYAGTAAAAHERLFPLVRRLLPTDPVARDVFDGDEAAMRWLDEERPNLVAAAERAAISSELHGYCRELADALRGYFSGCGYAADGVALANAALKAADAAADTRAKVVALALRGMIAYNVSDYDDAVVQVTGALALCGQDQVAEVECRHFLGRVYAQLGKPHEAKRHHERALAVARRIGDERTEAREINYVGVALLSLGRIDSAIACHTKAVELSSRIDNHHISLIALNGLGLAHWTAGRLREAAEYHEESVRLCKQWGLRHYGNAALVCLAETLCDLGRYAEADDVAREALVQGQEVGERRLEAGALEILATAARRRGRLAESIEGYTAALSLSRAINFRYGEVSILIGLAAAHRATGDPTGAVAHAELALTKMNETGMRVLECAALTELAAAQLDLGDLDAANRQVERALKIAKEDGQRLSQARALLVAERIRDFNGEAAAARENRTSALAILRELGVPESE
ncbi:BTAD domain-containing putative transcriptional regulator [Amycolatopsis coloradensis]|uniref:BTAD domain-containing putative transcriptional regulator n=1 Tax=Amycolatopsis coloradensis TaxID=76021 RepID=A0ACD5B461_9PSEU